MADENNMSELKSRRIDAWYGDSTSNDALKARDGQMKTSMKQYADSAIKHFAEHPEPGNTKRTVKRRAKVKSEYSGV